MPAWSRCPRTGPGLAFPAEALAAAAATADLVWLCVPHNPIGDRPAQDAIDRVIEATAGVAVVDAAYAEFAGDRWGPIVGRPRRAWWCWARCSKAFALAGARVGYAVAHPDRAALLDRLRPPGSVSSVSVALALRALAGEGLDGGARRPGGRVAGRTSPPGSVPWAGIPLPSTTNFVLCEIGPDAGEVAQRMMDRGVAVRAFGAGHPLAEYLRFSVRLEDQQTRMLETLEKESR